MAETISAAATKAACSKPHREDLAPGEVLCSHCAAKCCRYIALAIDTPETWKDFDYVRWYVLHERAAVFVEEDSWYLLVHNPCKYLGEDNLCKIYETRPQICRDYTTKNCEYEDAWVYDHLWETHEQIEEYAEAVLGPRKGRRFRSPQPKPTSIGITT